MIERISRAIDPEAWDDRRWSSHNVADMHARRQAANAAALRVLAAIQQPTDEMIAAGADGTNAAMGDGKAEAMATWRAMVEVALTNIDGGGTPLFVIVPREPTSEMIRAGEIDDWEPVERPAANVASIYRAMVAEHVRPSLPRKQ